MYVYCTNRFIDVPRTGTLIVNEGDERIPKLICHNGHVGVTDDISSSQEIVRNAYNGHALLGSGQLVIPCYPRVVMYMNIVDIKNLEPYILTPFVHSEYEVVPDKGLHQVRVWNRKFLPSMYYDVKRSCPHLKNIFLTLPSARHAYQEIATLEDKDEVDRIFNVWRNRDYEISILSRIPQSSSIIIDRSRDDSTDDVTSLIQKYNDIMTN